MLGTTPWKDRLPGLGRVLLLALLVGAVAPLEGVRAEEGISDDCSTGIFPLIPSLHYHAFDATYLVTVCAIGYPYIKHTGDIWGSTCPEKHDPCQSQGGAGSDDEPDEGAP